MSEFLPGTFAPVGPPVINWFVPSDLGQLFAASSGGSQFFNTSSVYRSFQMPVTVGGVYSIRRLFPLTDRLQVVFSADEPAPGVEWIGSKITANTAETIEGITVPAGASWMHVYLSASSQEIPGVLIEKSPTAGAWFDGNSANTDYLVHAWMGAPNASPSTQQEMEAVMATVYGTLSDFGLQSLAPYNPVVKFLPSGPGVRGQHLFSSTPITANVASNGSFSVLLEPTVGVMPDVWYNVSIEHLNAGGEYTHFDLLGYKLRVIPPGGEIGDMPDAPLSTSTVLVSLAPPPEGYKGWYLNAAGPGQDPGDPNDPASSGTGILEIVS